MVQRIEVYEVRRQNEDGDWAGHVAYITDENEAIELQRRSAFVWNDKTALPQKTTLVIYDTVADWEEDQVVSLRRQALAKLTTEERIALGV